MTTHTINSETALQTFIGDLRETWKARKFLTVNIVTGKKRSGKQNNISHAWYEQIARELREDTPRGVKRFCKLHFGVPILRAGDDEFRECYDASILRTLTYEQKLVAMDVWPVTSRMTTVQLKQYTDDMQTHYFGQVALEYPPEEAAA
jgi:hypothetical protein